jgi:hypothetical protein
MRGRRILIWTAAFALVGILFDPTTRLTHAQTVLFDDFNAPEIDPDKWVGEEVQLQGFGALESIRDIDFNPALLQGRLLMSHRAAGGTSSNTGITDSRNRLRARHGRVPSAVKFDVVVTQVSVIGCATPGSAVSSSRLQSTVFLFNDGSSTGPQDATGDIGMVIGQGRNSNSSDPAGVLQAFGTLFRCADSRCFGFPDLGVVGLGPVGTGETVTLQMNWDQVTKTVTYQKNAGPVQSITYLQDDSRAPALDVKSLQVVGAPANCSAAPRPITEITAFFDNVFYSP